MPEHPADRVADVTVESPFRRVALVVHPTRPIDRALATLTRWALAHRLELVQLANRGETHRRVAPPADVAEGDLVVALGGDGTVLSGLRAAAAANVPAADSDNAAANVPVLGVACGSLGALSAVSADRLDAALERLWAADWTPRALPVLAIAGRGAGDDWAVNDFVVVRRGAGQVAVAVSVDDEPYVRLAGDGLIVATVLGSSAYSMAAGGPVLAADTPAFVCTPLAMHGGSAPPLVVPADAALTVEVDPGYVGFDVEIDGRRHAPGAHHFRLALDAARVTLVSFDATGRGLAGLRRRRIIIDSPRISARDDRVGQ